MYDYKKIISICQITGEDNRMMRLVDVDDVFFSLPEIDGTYKGYQRDRLFYSQQKFPNMQTGQLGVWEWYVNDEDRVISEYLEEYTPYEVIKKYSLVTEEELSNALRTGLDIPYCKHDRLLLFKSKKVKQNDKKKVWRAVLCKCSDFKNIKNKIPLNDNIYALPCFDICEEDILQVYSKTTRLSFYLYSSFELPNQTDWLVIRNPQSVVKGLLLDRFNKRFLMDNGVSRKEASQFRKLIEQLTEEEMPDKISSSCHIPFEVAMNYWQQFIDKFNLLLRGEDIDNKILRGLLKEDDSLRQRLKEEWLAASEVELKQEHEKLFKEQEICKVLRGELELEKQTLANELEGARSKHQKKMELIQQEILAAEEHLKDAQEKAAYYEQLGEESMHRVREKLALAREDAAGFLADLALFGIYDEQARMVSLHSSTAIPSSFRFQPGKPAEEQELVQNTEESLDLLQDNLKTAGAEHEKALAYFLYGAFQSGMHLLLAGPQGAAVADALSCAMTGCHAAVLDCCGAWTPMALETALRDDAAVIVVKHPFLHRWIDHLISELDNTGKMWIFVHPYAEDLSLEPAALYSYVFPVILDIFITNKTFGASVGCHKANEYQELSKCEDVKDMVSAIKMLGRNPNLKNKGKELIAWACSLMNGGCKEFFRFACLLFPLAMALDRKQELHEKLEAENNLSSTDKRFLEDLLGERF